MRSENLAGRSALIRIAFVCALVIFASALPASANTTYTYTGQPFVGFSGTDSCSGGVGECSISGSFTVATPLGDNFAFSEITPLSFSFTDGVTTINQSNFSTIVAFEVGTDGSGDINQWQIQVLTDSDFQELLTYSSDRFGLPIDMSGLESTTAPYPFIATAETGVLGSWGPNAGTVPEPSALILLGSGLLGVLGTSLRRKQSA
jgi:hypothetical protein